MKAGAQLALLPGLDGVDFQEERWAPIPGFDNYRVSDMGRILSTQSGKVRALSIGTNGYLCIHLWRANKGHPKSVHRLVAVSFCYQPPGARVVNHIDGNRTNNCAKNLEWCTHAQNAIHAVRVLKTLVPPKFNGVSNRMHRPVVQIDPRTGSEVAFATMTEAAGTRFDIRGIYAACSGEQVTHYGYRWRYAAPGSTKSHNRARERVTLTLLTKEGAAVSSNGSAKPAYRKGAKA